MHTTLFINSYMCVGSMPHIVGKLSMMVTTLLEISLQLEVTQEVMGT
jgi:hypothetical protein